jgi:myo-inositol-1(or 4)-monophosphatase
MDREIELVVEATRQASKFLMRDYFELEGLQASNRNSFTFSQKSCTKIMQLLQERLSKYFNTVILDNKEVHSASFAGKAVLIETIDGFSNLTRALPFFAIMVTIITRKNGQLIAEKSIMNFPVLGEVYYTEKGKGAWLERYNFNFPGVTRLRVSGIENIEDAITSTTSANLSKLPTSLSNIRIFDSYTYSLALLITGKIDIIIIEERNISTLGVQLFIEEAAGAFQIKDKIITGSNFKLNKNIQHLFN